MNKTDKTPAVFELLSGNLNKKQVIIHNGMSIKFQRTTFYLRLKASRERWRSSGPWRMS